MEQVGYSLVDTQGNEIQVFGDTAGQTQGVPSAIRLPSGDDVHCPDVNVDYEGVRLVERWLSYDDAQSILFDGQKTVVTRPEPQPASIDEKLASVGLTIDGLKAALGLAEQ